MSEANDRNISIGDIAKLKSGGPRMVISGIAYDHWLLSKANERVVTHLSLALANQHGLFQITVDVDAVIMMPKKRARRGR